MDRLREGFQFRRRGRSVGYDPIRRSDDGKQLRRATIGDEPGRSGRGRATGPLFQPRRADGDQRDGILADKNLLEVVETIFGLPTAFSAGNIDTQAKILGNLLDVSDLQNPAKLSRLTERFTAAYDLTYNSPTSTSSLTVTGSSSSEAATSPAAGALAVLSGIVSSNASYSGTFFSASLLQSLQKFTLGG